MLKLGDTIGILGGGQLGRMLSMAASKLGYKTHIYDPNHKAPAFEITTQRTIGSFTDSHLLEKFAKTTDVVTYEFENIPIKTLEEIEKFVTVFPKKNALSVSQDRILEKNFFQSLNLRTVEYAPIECFKDYLEAIDRVKIPSILKTCRDGYDGKGQLTINKTSKKSEIKNHLLHGPCVLERLINFDKEISVIIARNELGNVVSFDPGENKHRSGILHSTVVPSQIPNQLQMDAVIIAGKIANALNYVGVLGVEMFLTSNYELIVNEIAPRVHNSGHWTQNGCVVDQFEQHIRAISGRKLGNGERHSDVTMINIIGEDINRINNISDGSIHLYGKRKIRPGRKMGHINYVTQRKS